MITKDGLYAGQPVTLACDEQCNKAWGMGDRPRRYLSEFDEDDWEYLADGELGIAPQHPGSYEGEHTKPLLPEERLNKWCCRACERCVMVDRGQPINLPDFSRRVRNIMLPDDAGSLN